MKLSLAQEQSGDGSGLDYNPRCLKRDVSLFFSNTTKPTDVIPLITDNDNLEAFSDFFQLPLGLHGGGHCTIGGDPGGDPYVIPDGRANRALPYFLKNYLS